MTDLITAVREENLEKVKEILESNSDVKEVDEHGRTALHYCAEYSKTDIAELLLNIDSSIANIKDKDDGYTPLHLAVISSNIELIKCLISHNVDLNIKDNESHFAMHWASVCGQEEVISLLVNAGANINSKDGFGATPLHYAAQLYATKTEEDDKESAKKILQKLLELDDDVDSQDNNGRSALLWAASVGSQYTCKMLLDKGANINFPDKDGLTALHCAASQGCVEVINFLSDSAEIEAKDKNGCTPLFYAVSNGHAEAANALLKSGANPSETDLKRRSPAHCAASKGHLDCLKILREFNGDLWLTNLKEECAIHEASLQGYNEIVNYLLSVTKDKGNINKANIDGRTCLHIATLMNNLDLCKLLVDKDADLDAIYRIKNKSMKPYDIAVYKKYYECAKLVKPKNEKEKEGEEDGNDDKMEKEEEAAEETKQEEAKQEVPKDEEPEEKETVDEKQEPRKDEITQESKEGDKEKIIDPNEEKTDEIDNVEHENNDVKTEKEGDSEQEKITTKEIEKKDEEGERMTDEKENEPSSEQKEIYENEKESTSLEGALEENEKSQSKDVNTEAKNPEDKVKDSGEETLEKEEITDTKNEIKEEKGSSEESINENKKTDDQDEVNEAKIEDKSSSNNESGTSESKKEDSVDAEKTNSEVKESDVQNKLSSQQNSEKNIQVNNRTENTTQEAKRLEKNSTLESKESEADSESSKRETTKLPKGKSSKISIPTPVPIPIPPSTSSSQESKRKDTRTASRKASAKHKVTEKSKTPSLNKKSNGPTKPVSSKQQTDGTKDILKVDMVTADTPTKGKKMQKDEKNLKTGQKFLKGPHIQNGVAKTGINSELSHEPSEGKQEKTDETSQKQKQTYPNEESKALDETIIENKVIENESSDSTVIEPRKQASEEIHHKDNKESPSSSSVQDLKIDETQKETTQSKQLGLSPSNENEQSMKTKENLKDTKESSVTEPVAPAVSATTAIPVESKIVDEREKVKENQEPLKHKTSEIVDEKEEKKRVEDTKTEESSSTIVDKPMDLQSKDISESTVLDINDNLKLKIEEKHVTQEAKHFPEEKKQNKEKKNDGILQNANKGNQTKDNPNHHGNVIALATEPKRTEKEKIDRKSEHINMWDRREINNKEDFNRKLTRTNDSGKPKTINTDNREDRNSSYEFSRPILKREISDKRRKNTPDRKELYRSRTELKSREKRPETGNPYECTLVHPITPMRRERTQTFIAREPTIIEDTSLPPRRFNREKTTGNVLHKRLAITRSDTSPNSSSSEGSLRNFRFKYVPLRPKNLDESPYRHAENRPKTAPRPGTRHGPKISSRPSTASSSSRKQKTRIGIDRPKIVYKRIDNHIQEAVRLFELKKLATQELNRAKRLTVYNQYRGSITSKTILKTLMENYNEKSIPRYRTAHSQFRDIRSWQDHLKEQLVQVNADEKAYEQEFGWRLQHRPYSTKWSIYTANQTGKTKTESSH